MSKLIDKENFWLQITSRYKEWLTLEQLQNELGKAPTVDAAPIKYGYWLMSIGEYGVCDSCGHIVDLMDGSPHNYCPDCGARMEEE